jgi:multiple sugar transport system substrate-binding protein
MRPIIASMVILTLMLALSPLMPRTAAQGTKLTLWSTLTQDERVAVMRKLIERFEKENAGTSVELVTMPWGGALDKMNAAILAGNAPDLSTVGQGWPQSLSGTGGIVPLDDLIQRLGPDKFVGTSLRVMGSLDGKVWSVPVYVTPHGFFYRKSWLAEKNVAPPKTWDEFYKAAVAMTDRKRNRYAWTIPFDIHGGKAVWAWLLSDGETIFVPKQGGGWALDFDSPRTVETYEFLKRIHLQAAPAGAPSYSQPEIEELFAKEVLGMYYETPGVLLTVKKMNPKILGDVGYFPVPPGKRRGSGQGWVGFVVYKTPRAELAKKFVEFMFRQDNLVEFTLSYPYFHFPAYGPALTAKAYTDHVPPELQGVVRDAPEILKWSAGISMWQGPNPWAGEIEAKMILPRALAKILVNHMPVPQAVREADGELRGLMQR